ncbi:MAG: hypothetical protein P794_04815 [Epsilonproteobacteria bacterium (ex Lamellibrachia satsuma)]|nr:MAG: hypothetical protein P794_04815 [Epsilonproteobacteria bacterium (ex Lamellibrachia satsuma)]
MEFMDLLREGAALIESNSDDATTGLDIGDIAQAFQGIVANSEGGLDLVTFVGRLSQNGLGEIIGSWLGNAENKPISTEQIAVLIGSEKLEAFASKLNISQDSAAQALADVLPQVVDRATSGENSIVDQMLGGSGNPMEVLGKMFR